MQPDFLGSVPLKIEQTYDGIEFEIFYFYLHATAFSLP
jgi:hypothetical protein